MKYFKIDKDKREIIIDKTKHYNVNVDILDLIIDLQLEYYEGVKDAEKHLKSLLNNAIKAKDKEIERLNGIIQIKQNRINKLNKKIIRRDSIIEDLKSILKSKFYGG